MCWKEHPRTPDTENGGVVNRGPKVLLLAFLKWWKANAAVKAAATSTGAAIEVNAMTHTYGSTGASGHSDVYSGAAERRCETGYGYSKQAAMHPQK